MELEHQRFELSAILILSRTEYMLKSEPNHARQIATIFVVILASTASWCQEAPKENQVPLPELFGYKVGNDHILLGCRLGPEQSAFVRKLRAIPVTPSDTVVTSLLFDRYLHKKSNAVATEFCYIESDWISKEELAVLASIARHGALQTKDLFQTKGTSVLKEVFVKDTDDYRALVDAWADSDRIKRQARKLGSVCIGEYRCGNRADFSSALSLVMADSVNRNAPEYLYYQDCLSEAMHAFVTSFVVVRHETFMSTEATTPVTKRDITMNPLFEAAKEYLLRPTRDSLENILNSELNALTLERLSVGVAFITFLMNAGTEKWRAFWVSMERESIEAGKIKGPEGRRAALRTAIKDTFQTDFEGLDKQLQGFVSKNYLYPEELGVLIGVDRECDASAYKAFAKACEAKRAKKAITEKQERVHADILGRIEKKLRSHGEKF